MSICKTGKDTILFSKQIADKNTQGVTADKVQEAVDEFRKRFKGTLAGTDVRVVGTQYGAFGSAGTGLGRVKGGYNTNKDQLILIAENLRDKEDIQQTL